VNHENLDAAKRARRRGCSTWNYRLRQGSERLQVCLELVRQMRQAGTPLLTNDLWVAATAMETGARLVTYDDHFQHVPGLLVDSP
jgi:predicted nucleic acid-binding protein